MKKKKKVINYYSDIIKKIRRVWTRNPATTVIPNRKYNRKRDKKIKEEDYE